MRIQYEVHGQLARTEQDAKTFFRLQVNTRVVLQTIEINTVQYPNPGTIFIFYGLLSMLWYDCLIWLT